jgi:hypothetical protein
MRNFEQTIYPITPYCEYLATSYLIDKNKKDLTNDDIKTLKDLSANPSDSYLLHFINNMQTVARRNWIDSLFKITHYRTTP